MHDKGAATGRHMQEEGIRGQDQGIRQMGRQAGMGQSLSQGVVQVGDHAAMARKAAPGFRQRQLGDYGLLPHFKHLGGTLQLTLDHFLHFLARRGRLRGLRIQLTDPLGPRTEAA